MGARIGLLLAGLLLAGCAAGRANVVVATADGAERYVGERTRGGGDAFALTARSGAACDDGRVGMLLFDGTATSVGGPVTGVIDQRRVTGNWGSGGAV